MPMPDDSMVAHSEIVGREVRVAIFEDNRNTFVANCLNLECNWKMEYEDRVYFNLNGIENENQILVKIPELEFFAKDKKYSLVFEFVNFVRKIGSTTTLAMTAGFSKFNLADGLENKSFSIDIIGGSPQRERNTTIKVDDIRHKRRGFIPKLASLFEGKVLPKLLIKTKHLKHNPAKVTELEEELELLPEMVVVHAPQVKILSYFRQCQGRDAFTVSGTVASMTRINTHLSSEIYVNSFCYLFCMPTCAATLAHFWNTNVESQYSKEKYELRMDLLKFIFNYLYATLNSYNFHFQRHYPTNQLYGRANEILDRKAVLKKALTDIWANIQESFVVKKIVAPKFMDQMSKVTESSVETSYSTFNIQELMDDDFDIQI